MKTSSAMTRLHLIHDLRRIHAEGWSRGTCFVRGQYGVSRLNPVLRQNFMQLSGRGRPTLSGQAKERLGDCRQEGRPAVRARRAATEGRRTFRGWGGEQPKGRTGPIVANRLTGSGRPSDVAMVEATDF